MTRSRRQFLHGSLAVAGATALPLPFSTLFQTDAEAQQPYLSAEVLTPEQQTSFVSLFNSDLADAVRVNTASAATNVAQNLASHMQSFCNTIAANNFDAAFENYITSYVQPQSTSWTTSTVQNFLNQLDQNVSALIYSQGGYASPAQVNGFIQFAWSTITVFNPPNSIKDPHLVTVPASLAAQLNVLQEQLGVFGESGFVATFQGQITQLNSIVTPDTVLSPNGSFCEWANFILGFLGIAASFMWLLCGFGVELGPFDVPICAVAAVIGGIIGIIASIVFFLC